jgi:hypothetical protein
MHKDIKSNGTFKGMYTACYIENSINFFTAFTAARRSMFSDFRSQLKCAEILPEHRYHKDRTKIARELLKKGFISEDTYYGLAGADTGGKLLEANVFAFRFNSQEVTFQSTVTKRFCERNSALWESKA